MGIETAKKSNTSKTHSNENKCIVFPSYDLYVEIKNNNENYEKGGLVFPSKNVYRLFKSLDKNLRFLYTPGDESRGFETINDSEVRHDKEEYDHILTKVEDRIKIILLQI